MEKWKDIKGYEGYYKISNHGRVLSVKNGKHKYLSLNKTNGKGNYHISSLCKDGEQKNYYIHRLVAEHFIENPNSTKTLVNHKDSNRSNNHVDNLEWVNHQENMLHCIGSGRKTDMGHNSPNTRLTQEQVLEMLHNLDKNFTCYEDLMVKYNMSLSGIKSIEIGFRHRINYELYFKTKINEENDRLVYRPHEYKKIYNGIKNKTKRTEKSLQELADNWSKSEMIGIIGDYIEY